MKQAKLGKQFWIERRDEKKYLMAGIGYRDKFPSRITKKLVELCFYDYKIKPSQIIAEKTFWDKTEFEALKKLGFDAYDTKNFPLEK